MTDHLAVLEEIEKECREAARISAKAHMEGTAYDFMNIADRVAAAIALMRGHSDMVLVPRTLTAENGAKGALIGEFTTPFVMQCLECTDGFVDDEVCDDCDGAGSFTVRVPVEWTTIKDIHKAMIAHFHPAPKDTGDAVTGRVNGYMFSARAIEIIADGEVPEWITKAPGLRVTITAMQAKEAK